MNVVRRFAPFIGVAIFMAALGVIYRELRLAALLGPSRKVKFEFRLTDWIGVEGGEDALPVGPEVAKLRGMDILCFYGEEEKGSLCRDLDPALAKPVMMGGSHHFGGAYAEIARRILAEAGGR